MAEKRNGTNLLCVYGQVTSELVAGLLAYIALSGELFVDVRLQDAAQAAELEAAIGFQADSVRRNLQSCVVRVFAPD